MFKTTTAAEKSFCRSGFHIKTHQSITGLEKINKEILMIQGLTSFFSSCVPMRLSNESTPVMVSEGQFKQLSCRPVGHCKHIRKTSCRTKNREGVVNYGYFSGLVYRLDTRNITELKDAGGFFPRKKRNCNDPVLLKDIVPHGGLHPLMPVHTLNVDGVVATSKYINITNGLKPDNYQYHYMIDTAIVRIYGLDPDFSVGSWSELVTGEICYEDRLPFKSIVGYFNGKRSPEFYKNPDYAGYFSWDVEDLVEHYKKHTPLLNPITQAGDKQEQKKGKGKA